MKYIIITIIAISLSSCQYKPNKTAVDLIKKANEIGYKSKYQNSAQADSALVLINKAIETGEKYLNAYQLKTI